MNLELQICMPSWSASISSLDSYYPEKLKLTGTI